jgi:guanylate kinase
MSKLIILTAPSGAGKTTIVRYLLEQIPELAFSISATTRVRRPNEVEGVDYYYIGVEAFQGLIEEEAFAEWQEVYPNQYYGTLHSEMERIWLEGKHIVFDIDVKGAVNLKKLILINLWPYLSSHLQKRHFLNDCDSGIQKPKKACANV